MREAENVGNDNMTSNANNDPSTGTNGASTPTGRLHLRVLDDTDTGAYAGIGDELRAIREQRGETIREVADTLCIRAVLIEALETGDFDALPGDIYITGFLKTYATHLGQSPEDVIARFKAERDDTDTPEEDQVYNFPRPVREDSAPKGPLLIVAIILAIGIYGAWYWSNQSEKVDLSETPAVPERFASVPNSWNQDLDRLPRDTSEAPANNTAPAAASAETEATEPVETLSTEKEIPDTAPLVSVEETILEAPEQPVVAASTPQAPAADTVPAELPTEPSAISSAETSTPSSEDTLAAFAAQQPAAETGTAPLAEEPVLTGDLTLKATGAVWVQIKNENGLTRFSGIMRENDTYSVEGEESLFLMTGDAGSLQILNQSDVLGVLGSTGEAKTHVPLTLTGIRTVMGLN